MCYVCGGIALGTKMEVSGQLHAPVALPWGEKPWYPLDTRLGGPRASLDAVVRRKNFSLFQESNPDRPACSLNINSF